ncbi:hypothetical protein, partial [Limosilactobacillus reuteri]|uniref:hypothetical protein n=1 Tax=Limosilactobacillus reuteri TaxID=1598 RepID=UPI002B0572B0
WLLTNPKLHSASILTLNTYGLKGAIKAIADGLPRYKGKPAYIRDLFFLHISLVALLEVYQSL